MRILRMMKKNRVVLTLVCATMVMMLATGCGKEKEAPVPIDLSSGNVQDEEEDKQSNPGDGEGSRTDDDRSAVKDNEENQETKKDSGEKADDKTAKDTQSQMDDELKENNAQASQASGTEELDCNVISVGQDSFIASKNTTYSDGDGDIVVGRAPGYEEADDLVTVYVNENCSYQYETVRNGGVNPEDVSVREGSFGDLKANLACIVKGSWRDGSFYADSIVMMEFT